MNWFKRTAVLFHIILLAGIILVVSSCDFSEDKPAVSYSYSYQKNAIIKVDTTWQRTAAGDSTTTLHFSIQQGNKLVFIYKKIDPGPENVSDAGKTSILVFQLPREIKNFDYQDNQMQTIQAFYREDCFCANGGLAVPVKIGLIKGERINPVGWIIKVDVTIPYFENTIRVKFDQPFYDKSLI